MSATSKNRSSSRYLHLFLIILAAHNIVISLASASIIKKSINSAKNARNTKPPSIVTHSSQPPFMTDAFTSLIESISFTSRSYEGYISENIQRPVGVGASATNLQASYSSSNFSLRYSNRLSRNLFYNQRPYAVPTINKSTNKSNKTAIYKLDKSVDVKVIPSTDSTHSNSKIYVRFIDLWKPSFLVNFNISYLTHFGFVDPYNKRSAIRLTEPESELSLCSILDSRHLNLKLLASTGFDENDLLSIQLTDNQNTTQTPQLIDSPFEVDADSLDCYKLKQTRSSLNCLCYFDLMLRDGSFIEKLNREATDTYRYKLVAHKNNNSTTSASIAAASLIINVLDDNDLEPMFDPSEYIYELSEYNEKFELTDLPPLSSIGRIVARDPDLSLNGIVRYYMTNICSMITSSQSAASDSSLCSSYFGINWYTGEIYLKRSLRWLFDNELKKNESINFVEFQFEVKAVDYGLKSTMIKHLVNSIKTDPINKKIKLNIGKLNQTNRKSSEFSCSNQDFIASLFDEEVNIENDMHGSDDIEYSFFSYSSLETAYAKIRLTRNLKELFKVNSQRSNKMVKNFRKLGNLPESALYIIKEIIKYDVNKLPLAVFHLKEIDNLDLNRIKLLKTNRSQNSINLNYLSVSELPNYSCSNQVEGDDCNSSVKSFAIFAHLNESNSIFQRSIAYNGLYQIAYCDYSHDSHKKDLENSNCANLFEFKMNIKEDFSAAFSSLCSFSLTTTLNSSEPLQLDSQQMSSNESIFMFRINFDDEICQLNLENGFKTLYVVKYVKINDNDFYSINETNGLVKLLHGWPNSTQDLRAKAYIRWNTGGWASSSKNEAKVQVLANDKGLLPPSIDLDGLNIISVELELYDLSRSLVHRLSEQASDSELQMTTYYLIGCYEVNSSSLISLYPLCPFYMSIENQLDSAIYLNKSNENLNAHSNMHYNLLIRIVKHFTKMKPKLISYAMISVKKTISAVFQDHSYNQKFDMDQSMMMMMQLSGKIRRIRSNTTNFQLNPLVEGSVNEDLKHICDLYFERVSAFESQSLNVFRSNITRDSIKNLYYQNVSIVSNESILRTYSALFKIDLCASLAKSARHIKDYLKALKCNYQLLDDSKEFKIFRIERFSGSVRLIKDLYIPSYKGLIKDLQILRYRLNILVTNEINYNNKISASSSLIIDIEIKLSKQESFVGVYLPKVFARKYNYVFDLREQARSSLISDVLLLKRFDTYLYDEIDGKILDIDASNLYNCTYYINTRDHLRSIDELPFFVDTFKGSLFYSPSALSRVNFRRKYDFDVLVKLSALDGYQLTLAPIHNIIIKVSVISNKRHMHAKINNDASLLKQFNDLSLEMSQEEPQLITIDLTRSLTSTDMLAYLHSPVLGVVAFRNPKLIRLIDELDLDYSFFIVRNSLSTPHIESTSSFTRKIMQTTTLSSKATKLNKSSKNSIGNKYGTNRAKVSIKDPHVARQTTSNKKVKQSKLSLSKRSTFMDEYVFNYENRKKLMSEESSILIDYNEQEESIQIERDLIDENELLNNYLIPYLKLDESNGVLYLNLSINQSSELNRLSRLVHLINYYVYHKKISFEQLTLNVSIVFKGIHQITIIQSVRLILLFKKFEPSNALLSPTDKLSSRKFVINSNNLLNLFMNGNEFLVSLNVIENRPAWYINQAKQEYIVRRIHQTPVLMFDVAKYLRSRVDARKSFLYSSQLDNLKYYISEEDWKVSNLSLSNSASSYFVINEVNGLLISKPNIQFDYEVESHYLIKIMIVQSVSQEQTDTNDEQIIDEKQSSERVMVSALKPSEFMYWLDLHINVLNAIDEPFVCSQPVYYVSIDENEPKNKRIFTIKLIDYDGLSEQATYDGRLLETPSELSRFRLTIVSGNSMSLFTVNGHSIQTSSLSRKLDREARKQHELDMRIVDEEWPARFAQCKLLIDINDINDNRPVVNDIELLVYNKLDPKLVDELRVPIANAIAIDPDHLHKLTYSIASVRVLSAASKRKLRQTTIKEANSFGNELYDLDGLNAPKNRAQNSQKANEPSNELQKLFRINNTNGNVYSTSNTMPCVDCTIQILYKATDLGRGKTRSSRKSSIKLHVRSIPLSLFRIHSDDLDAADEHDYSMAAAATVDRSSNASLFTPAEQLAFTSQKTFELISLKNDSIYNIVLNVSEDTKLGEKLYQIKANKLTKQAEQHLTVIYFTLLEQQPNEAEQSFYISNHDGTLYLVRELDYERTKVYNLSVLVTNWLGQIEYVYIQIQIIDVNDNVPKFVFNNVTSNSLVINEIIPVDYDPDIRHISSENYKLVELLGATDADELDTHKLTFKIEDCFYTSINLLMNKSAILSNYSESNEIRNIYPLCSNEYLELIWFNSNSNSLKQVQSLRLKINLSKILLYLSNSSDLYYLLERAASTNTTALSSSLRFHMDISVKDSSLVGYSIIRVHLNLDLDKKILKTSSKSTQTMLKSVLNKDQILLGFRQPIYLISIDSLEQLQDGRRLISLSEEFVCSEPYIYTFNPFDLHCTLLKNSKQVLEDYLIVEANTGSVYLNKTLFHKIFSSNSLNQDKLIFEVVVTCNVNSQSSKVNLKRQFSNITGPLLIKTNSEDEETIIINESRLYNTTKLILSISSLILRDLTSAQITRIDELTRLSIWQNSSLVAYIEENVVAGSTLYQDIQCTKPFTAASYLNLRLIDKTLNELSFGQYWKRSIIYFLQASVEQQNRSTAINQFEIEMHTGYIKVKFEPDYEIQKRYDLYIEACIQGSALLTFKTQCYKQKASLNVIIINKNDNEPKMKLLGHWPSTLSLMIPSELIRSMSLFKLIVIDLDGDLNELIYKLGNLNKQIVVSHRVEKEQSLISSSKCSNLTISALESETKVDLTWFSLFEMSLNKESNGERNLCIKLNDYGYEQLIKAAKTLQTLLGSECNIYIELVASASDGLFSNEIRLGLNIMSDTSNSVLAIRSSLMAPILHSFEFNEQDIKKPLLELNSLLVNYIYSNSGMENAIGFQIYKTLGLLEFELKNYEDIFEIDGKLSKTLAMRAIDYNQSISHILDTYELFINVRVNESCLSDLEAQLSLFEYMDGYLSETEKSSRHLLIHNYRHHRYQLPSTMRLLAYSNNSIVGVSSKARPKFTSPKEIRSTRTPKSNYDLYYYNRTFSLTNLIHSSKTKPLMTVSFV
jgi:hypothetical protein